MCHCFESIDELTAEERADAVREHSGEELRAEFEEEELRKFGVA